MRCRVALATVKDKPSGILANSVTGSPIPRSTKFWESCVEAWPHWVRATSGGMSRYSLGKREGQERFRNKCPTASVRAIGRGSDAAHSRKVVMLHRLSICSGGIAGVMGLFFLFAPLDSVFGVPAFARQTEQQCIACHVSFPELTPYGRYFKLSGYTLGKAAISSEGLHHVPLAVMAEAS